MSLHTQTNLVTSANNENCPTGLIECATHTASALMDRWSSRQNTARYLPDQRQMRRIEATVLARLQSRWLTQTVVRAVWTCCLTVTKFVGSIPSLGLSHVEFPCSCSCSSSLPQSDYLRTRRLKLFFVSMWPIVELLIYCHHLLFALWQLWYSISNFFCFLRCFILTFCCESCEVANHQMYLKKNQLNP